MLSAHQWHTACLPHLPHDPEGFVLAVDRAVRASPPPDAVVWVGGAEGDPLGEQAGLGLLRLVQRLMHSGVRCRLWVATAYGVAVERWLPPVNPQCAAALGVARSVMQELPELCCTVVDGDHGWPTHATAQ